MKLLLDTNVALWAITDDDELDDRFRQAISDTGNEVFVSVVSTWEVELKHEKFPSSFTVTADGFIEDCERSGYNFLELGNAHVKKLEALHLKGQGIHQDPFDHLIMAQAVSEDMLLVTEDENMLQYEGVRFL